ncbi:MAG: tocopherol cyclase family protein [Bacillota bacterium]|nr:tocopherol cyclase family protein [Bacillota bacterium]
MEKIFNPIIFQGNLNRENYFEGWYFKQVHSRSEKTYAFIPGISLNKKEKHCFIQVIISPSMETYYFKFPLELFNYTENPFKIMIANNTFSKTGIDIDIDDKNFYIKGKLDYGEFQKIEKSLLVPNIMGYFAYIPKMECNHGVTSMNHSVDGFLKINDETLIFEEDKGYIEKDWGISFPEKYIWMQGNHFANTNDSFMCSIAKIPFLGSSFMGIIANLHFRDAEYRFGTYKRTKLKKLIIEEKEISFNLVNKDYSLKVKGIVEKSGILKSPRNGEMSQTIKEGLGGIIKLDLFHKGNIYHIESNHCGIEIVNMN